MTAGYFKRVAQETPTKFWINNPTLQEINWAIEAGARNCTTNPTYCSRLIDTEPEYMRDLIDIVVKEIADDDQAAEEVYKKATSRIVAKFWPFYQASGGQEGFVTIQGDPRRDDDADYILAESLRQVQISPCAMAKIPAIPSGIRAMEALVEKDVPICATEIFSISQAVDVWESYARAAQRSGNHPPLYVTHITGIYDKYLSQYVQAQGIDVAPDVLAQAGWAVAHEQYRIFQERGYEGLMLGGGAQTTNHFTDMVGGKMDTTINWSTAKELIDADGPVVNRIHWPAPKEVVEELSEKLPDFRLAFYEGELKPEQYKSFGPLVLFRNWFLDGYTRLVNEVSARRDKRG
jgi:transaldolase